MKRWFSTATLLAAAQVAFCAGHADLSGKVTDRDGKPLADAVVMVYHAGVKQGYNTFCPSCYVDCGKRALTDRNGEFTIKSLANDLYFELLVMHDGFAPTSVTKVDPVAGSAMDIALKSRPPVDDPERVVRGHVVNSEGEPMRAAVITPQGVEFMTDKGLMSSYGSPPGLEPMVATDSNGNFEISHSKKSTGMVLQIEARGMATKIVTLSTGAERHTVPVTNGSVVRGRLVNHGKPVAGVEAGLFPQARGGYGAHLKIVGDPYGEIRIGTHEDGTFVVTNVPTGVKWWAYGKMESIAQLGATVLVSFTSALDGQEVDLGDIEILPGYSLHGKVSLNDQRQIGPGMRITLSATKGFDSQTVDLAADGSFKFSSIPRGDYEVFPSVRGYKLTGTNYTVPVAIEKNVEGFALMMERGR